MDTMDVMKLMEKHITLSFLLYKDDLNCFCDLLVNVDCVFCTLTFLLTLPWALNF